MGVLKVLQLFIYTGIIESRPEAFLKADLLPIKQDRTILMGEGF